MYRMRLLLDISHPSARQGLRNCHDMHRNLLRAFSDASRAEVGLLYRVFSGEKNVAVYVQSELEPDVTELLKVGFCADQNGCPLNITPLREKFKQGRSFRFNLLCYPSKKSKEKSGEGGNSRRVFLKSEEERVAWISRKGEQYGFSVTGVAEKTSFSLNGGKNGAPIHYYAVEYEGVLTIRDEARFWNGYCGGIGAGKPYGLGLLLLKSV
ncbi:type I-E CRISPR-associated protein Cas6/Cse3/CasE [Synergistales bacterium]|nr:type I-E CRISPR-associated protein Cas6/Cse3/CasE [Synergistales bacterium]